MINGCHFIIPLWGKKKQNWFGRQWSTYAVSTSENMNMRAVSMHSHTHIFIGHLLSGMNWFCPVKNSKYGITTANFQVCNPSNFDSYFREILKANNHRSKNRIRIQIKHEWNYILYLKSFIVFTFVSTFENELDLVHKFLIHRAGRTFPVMLTVGHVPKILDEVSQKDVLYGCLLEAM